MTILSIRRFIYMGLFILTACESQTAVSPTATNHTTNDGQPSPTVVTPETTTESDIEEVAEATAVLLDADRQPQPTLFDIPWNERDIFKEGLIEEQQNILSQLDGASIYHLNLQVEEGLSVVAGQQEVRYTNQEETTLNEVYFHLHPNLLGGSIEITNVTVNDQTITPIFESFNNSVMRIPLAEPLVPDAHIVIYMDFLTSIPIETGRNYGIFAYTDEILALAHFYPQISVFDDEGWNITLPAEAGDVTYSDTSFYLVRVAAPEDTTVVAGGIEVARDTANDMQIVEFAAGPMRDFYIAISDRYTVVSQTIGQTQINSYAPAEFNEAAELALTHAINALRSFNGRFGTCPFTELDIVSTPTLALGIEYPGIIANAIRIYDLDDSSGAGTPNTTLLESTTVHEVAHQWYYSLIGNDQLDEPWLDESLTQYATWLYFRDQYGSAGDTGFQNSLQGRWARAENAEIPIGLPVSAYQGAEYGAIVYGRGPIFVDTIAQTMGQNTFDDFIKAYNQTYWWQIVTTETFKQMAEMHCACDLTTLFETWVYSSN